MKSSLRPWSKGFGQDLRLNTSLGNPLILWRSCFRKWMSTSGPIMISAREGKKLIGFLRWLGASEEESTLDMSDQSTIPVRVMTEADSFRGHSIAHSLQGNNGALSGHQLQGAEAVGASEEDIGTSPGNSIAYSVVKTRATLQEHARSPFRSKKRLPKQKRDRISRSRFYILLRATLPTYQNMWAINLQLLLLWQAIHKLLGLSSHCHHHCHLLIPKASSQKGASTPNSNATSGRSPKLVQSTTLYKSRSAYIEEYPTFEALLSFMPFYFLCEKQVMKNLVSISCNNCAYTRMKYIFFIDLRSLKNDS
jgi:hypothetical protein